MSILDTNVVIYLQNNQLKNALPQDNYAISIITEIELLSFSGLSSNQENWLHQFLVAVQIFPLNNAVKNATIKLRRNHKLKIPDAIIVATALIQETCLFTADKQILQIPKLKTNMVEIVVSSC